MISARPISTASISDVRRFIKTIAEGWPECNVVKVPYESRTVKVLHETRIVKVRC